MGYGNWTRVNFEQYSRSRGRTVTASGNLDNRYTAQDMFTQRRLHPTLDPKNVVRECCDSADHPDSIPVILALDVTGSMGPAAAEVAKKLNTVMTDLYDRVRDVEFMVMGIGDLYCDRSPIQISQFESDIRIAEQLDNVYFEYGGGGNGYESYTAAWYMGSRHTKLDCLKRGKKGLIITIGDEGLNPYLPGKRLAELTGDCLETDINTPPLYEKAAKVFEIYHLHVIHGRDYYSEAARRSFGKQLEEGHFRPVQLESITTAITDIVEKHAKNPGGTTEVFTDEKTGGAFGTISW